MTGVSTRANLLGLHLFTTTTAEDCSMRRRNKETIQKRESAGA
jgi:hypothetical protein